MPTAALSIISLLQYAPQAIGLITQLYNSIKDTFSPEDQGMVDRALAEAIASDAAATARANEALSKAEKR